MPQMAPLWWILLFMIFLWCLMASAINLFYFSSSKSKKLEKNQIEANMINWKW